MLVCEPTTAFYRAVHKAGLLQRSPTVLSVLDPFLPPSQIRLAREAWVVKASVVSIAALQVATSQRRKDQFLAGRLFQDVSLVWTRDDEARARIEAAIDSARRITLGWVAPDLPEGFDAPAYVRQLFRTSFRFEVRPENSGRADALYLAQSKALDAAFEGVLDRFLGEGLVKRNSEGTFSLTSPVSRTARFRRRAFMEWSRVRATARWPKHAITFDGWLDYIVRKAERHSGETIVLTPLERRFPFIFLGPRILRFLIRQRRKGGTV
jgi:hypothetical protein